MKKLASSQAFVRLEDTFYLRDAIISGLACFELVEYYDDAPIYIDCLRGIMEETQDYQKKPLLFMLEWKTALKLEGNYEKFTSQPNCLLRSLEMTIWHRN